MNKTRKRRTTKKKVVVIINPNAGFFANAHALDAIRPKARVSVERFKEDVKEFFDRQKIAVEFRLTIHPLDAMRFAKSAAGKVPIVIACGGDGTINEVINGIAKSKTALGILPLGTENAFARELGIPLDYKKALEKIIHGDQELYDLGIANDRYFLMMTGVGLDAHAAAELQPHLKRLLGRRSYHVAAIKTFFTKSPKRLRIWIDDQILPRSGYFIVVGNVKYYGGNVSITPYAEPNDGFLDVCIFKNKDIFNMLTYFFGVAYKAKHVEFGNIEYFRCKRVRVESDFKVLGHTDAEIIGTTPIDIRVVPKSLRIIC